MNNLNNIYIPFENFTSIGGPATFMSNLKKYLDESLIEYQSSIDKATAVFFPVQFDEAILQSLKNKGGKVIQRLDGIYYPSKHGNKHVGLNKDIKNIYLKYTDYVVFQSQYSKMQCFEMLGEKEAENYSVIYNGVHKDIFYSDDDHETSSEYNFITTGNFRNIDMLEPVILALSMLKKKVPLKFHVVGPITNPQIEKYLDNDFIVYHGVKNSKEIAGLLRESDIFIYSHLNPPCPNSALEAISCGLPVVGFDSGAMSELCWFSKDLLAYVSDDIFQKYEDFNPEALAEKIELCISNYKYYREKSLQHAHLYSFEECGKKYVEVFDRVIKIGSNSNNDIQGSKKRNILKVYLKNKMDSIRKILISRLSNDNFRDMIFNEINVRINKLNPSDALKLLFDIDNRLYEVEGRASIRYGNGLHTKHKHIKYHDFFINNIKPSNRMLGVHTHTHTHRLNLLTGCWMWDVETVLWHRTLLIMCLMFLFMPLILLNKILKQLYQIIIGQM